MNGDYKIMALALSIILLLVACVFLFMLYRKTKLDAKNLSDQLNSAYDSINKKADFFSNMTHELKTPVSVILGAVQLMETKAAFAANDAEKSAPVGRTSIENNLLDTISIIKSNCYRLVRLINNLLDFARMEAGYLVLKPVNCDLDILLEEIVSSVKPYAENRCLKLCYLKSREPVRTAVDMDKFERIMLNLLSNAIKFTDPGGEVCVSCRKAGEQVLISVKDTGIGIPREQWQEIFERFKQGSRYTSSGYEGSGIGLSIVNTFVKLHNGNISMASEPGKGTEFIVQLPIRQIDEKPELETNSIAASVAELAKIEFSHLHAASDHHPYPSATSKHAST